MHENGPTVQLSIKAPSQALTDSDAMGQLVLLIAKTVTLQLDDEELNVDGAEKRKSGGGKDNSEAARLATSRLQCQTIH